MSPLVSGPELTLDDDIGILVCIAVLLPHTRFDQDFHLFIIFNHLHLRMGTQGLFGSPGLQRPYRHLDLSDRTYLVHPTRVRLGPFRQGHFLSER